ncbi:hypothetical protein A1O7_02198 [Cladophialophora yegresii CBS 114405]|uniref:aldehyde dehydrogenase (NAD(+)) n=1 Tax=Cladophialophora yegresii CBS 114405 TaxID=1182544 RepID=W9W1C5_9EURO|nr:uncharacterized protein A1O7_02198 [Cladophialophora yegresii CBS 114405]EXJ61768.1 hypothetical protein A1O7_02198 [Cladophialophora yegresii CBS 114405]
MSFPNIEECLPKNWSLFFGGKWQEPQDGEYLEIYSPGDGKVIKKVAFAGAKDAAAAVEAAQAAFPAWRAHADELALLDAYNTGNPVSMMKADAFSAADVVDMFAGLIPAVQGETTHLDDSTFNYTLREPLGVVARIVASNHPLMFTANRLAAPIAMGNTVVIKLPEQAPLSGLRFSELVDGIFPSGVLNILSGGLDCGKVLSTHPLVKKVTLIGSVPTGKAIQKAAADTLKLTSYELGGKNALIAYPDADLERLTNSIVAGMNFGWCGQSCGSTSRVFLHEALHDEVLDRVRDKVANSFKPGNPIDPKTTMGALVSKAAQDRVLRYVEVAKQDRARLVLGVRVPEAADTKGGYFVEPTIFADVNQKMRIANEEVFGPILSILKWTDEEQLFKDVNAVEYGLTGAVFTSDIKTMQTAVRRIQAGTVWVNTVGTHFFSMPFGGYKQSGIGRDDCFEELRDMTQCKAVHVKL